MGKEVNVAILGLGTVGSSVYQILQQHEVKIENEVGAKVKVKWVLEKDPKKIHGLGVSSSIVAADPSDIFNDPTVDIVVEVMGGVEPAGNFILSAINKGKNVVTANKELLSIQGEEIMTAADEKGVDLFFEASVGGGIPIVKPLKESLAGNNILKVMGIVNGTTNYIFTRMSEEGCSFEDALRDAQACGYAEADPSADIEGRDAAAKTAILASIAFNSRVTLNDVYTEGIGKITSRDIMYAFELGFTIKLLALAKEEEGVIDVRVHPTMLPLSHPLAAVSGVNNAIFVEGDAVGEVMFYGPGAGGMAAGSSVVGDVVDIARNLQFKRTGKIGCTCFEKKKIRPIDEVASKYYLLIEVLDKPGVLAKIAKAFGDAMVSIASVIQKESRGDYAELVFMTHVTKEKSLNKALKSIRQLDVVKEVANVIRVEVS